MMIRTMVIRFAGLAMLMASGAHAAPGQSLMPSEPAALAQQQAFGYADAVVAGGMIHLSGVIAAPRPGETGFEPAYERAFQQIAATLKRAGASWADVVDITTYHTDLIAQAEAIKTVKNRHVEAPYPAWTAIGVTRLFEEAGITEIKVVALVPAK